MFDRFLLQPGPSHVSASVRVEEKRAPTDESVKLLREMEQAARNNIAESLRLKSNDFEAIVHRTDVFEHCATAFHIYYTFNGQRKHVKAEVESLGVHTSDAVDVIRTALADDIARSILGGITFAA